jgi:chemotaxis signal transduction protein
MIATPNLRTTPQISLADRFISTQVERFTLVFPAVWVAEILRIDRTQILDLPFYDSLPIGIINHKSQCTPLIAIAKLLDPQAVEKSSERVMVVKLNAAAGVLAHVGIVVDRAIGSATYQELPAAIFEPPTTEATTLLMRPELVPATIWQPQRWS